MKVSVIIPCFNQAAYLRETCDSVLSQTHNDWEALIINDGSTDNTKEVALEICKKDDRFIYFEKINGGLSSARNYGLDRVVGDFVQFLDSDDILIETKFEKSIVMNKDITITNFKMFENGIIKPPFCKLENQKINFENVLLNWDKDFSIPIHCGMFRISAISELRFDEDLKAKEDWLFWLMALENSTNIHFINESLVLYRLHDSNMCKDTAHMDEFVKKVYLKIFNKYDDFYKNRLFEELYDRFQSEKNKSDYSYNRVIKYKKSKRHLINVIIFQILVIIILVLL
jgi:hypothetical protein